MPLWHTFWKVDKGDSPLVSGLNISCPCQPHPGNEWSIEKKWAKRTEQKMRANQRQMGLSAQLIKNLHMFTSKQCWGLTHVSLYTDIHSPGLLLTVWPRGSVFFAHKAWQRQIRPVLCLTPGDCGCEGRDEIAAMWWIARLKDLVVCDGNERGLLITLASHKLLVNPTYLHVALVSFHFHSVPSDSL